MEWHRYFTMRMVMDLRNGIRIWGNVMRRKVNGRWQYREMTPAEAEEYQADMAW